MKYHGEKTTEILPLNRVKLKSLSFTSIDLAKVKKKSCLMEIGIVKTANYRKYLIADPSSGWT